jgi:hypothetical protein
MSTLISALKQQDTVTENGMVTNSSSLNNSLDLFFKIGAYRKASYQDIIRQFSLAFNESPLEAMKILFWGRDIRGGAGERRLFGICLEYLAKNHPDVILKNIHLISEYGRWDDVLHLIGSKVEDEAIALIKEALDKKDRLCAKWMPRKGAIANKLRKGFELTPKEYRKLLVETTEVVETPMCAKSWNLIDYSSVPSLAAARYQKAFIKNDMDRYSEYIKLLASPEPNKKVKINANAVYPYDVLKSIKRGIVEVANEQWKVLPNYMDGSNDMILPVVDVSGSMETPASGGNVTCMDVSVSLGLYISERNEGPFKDHFITFSEDPELQQLNGTLSERYEQLTQSSWGMSTNLEKVFKLILKQAKRHNIPQEQMPSKILILSDMEFNEALGQRRHKEGENSVSAIEMMDIYFEEAGYKRPDIIFWNIQSRGNNVPVKFDEKGTALVSGFSPSILKSILGAKDMTPISIMLDTINSPRYEKISV